MERAGCLNQRDELRSVPTSVSKSDYILFSLIERGAPQILYLHHHTLEQYLVPPCGLACDFR